VPSHLLLVDSSEHIKGSDMIGRPRARLPLLVVENGVVASQGLFSRGAAVKEEKKRT
jgi:hypothetical protein